MTPPSCAECKFGTITLHSGADRCEAPQNVKGYPPYAARHDETLCGSSAAWFVARGADDPVYKADVAVAKGLPKVKL